MMTTISDTFAAALRHHQAGDLRQAALLYQQILQKDAGHADTHHLLGVLAGQQGRIEEGVTAIKHALTLRPGVAIYHSNLGALLESRQQNDEAAAHLKQAIDIQPTYAEAHCKLAQVLAKQGNLDDAATHFQEAVRLNPNDVLAHNNLAEVLLKLGQLKEAKASFQSALRLRPDLAIVQSNLLFCMNLDPEADPVDVFADHVRWGQMQEAKLPSQRDAFANDPSPDRRLRIGYVSPDFRYHALTRYIEPVLAHHDSEQVEVFCYANVAKPDATTARLQGLADGWRSTIDMSDAQVVERIQSDKIDILVDLAGHTGNNRLVVFAHKPAPIQATWLGYLNTTGLKGIDYRLTDDILDPCDQPVRDTEGLVRLPNGMCCFAAPSDAPVITRPPCLRNGHLTFGSLHSLFKLNVAVFDLWSELLKAVPSAHLLMFRDTLTSGAKKRIEDEFTARGINRGRLDLRRGSHSPGYLKVYEEIDVTLDTFPCTGGVTTCEALWMGVPVLSLRGARPAGRNSAALLTRVGLGDWAVDSSEQYVAKGARLATELDSLAELRAGFRDRMRETFCDAGRFTSELEDTFRTLWRRWCAS